MEQDKLKTALAEDSNSSGEEAGGGIDIETAKKKMMKEDKVDKETYRQKIKKDHKVGLDAFQDGVWHCSA